MRDHRRIDDRDPPPTSASTYPGWWSKVALILAFVVVMIMIVGGRSWIASENPTATVERHTSAR
jgi:hypothetical protein